MIKNGEKAIIHIYANACGFSKQDYRSELLRITGKTSTTDPAFSHADVDKVMAYFESILEHLVIQCKATWPTIRGHQAQPRYWREKKGRPGSPSSRERYAEADVEAELENAIQILADYGKPRSYCDAASHRMTSLPNRRVGCPPKAHRSLRPPAHHHVQNMFRRRYIFSLDALLISAFWAKPPPVARSPSKCLPLRLVTPNSASAQTNWKSSRFPGAATPTPLRSCHRSVLGSSMCPCQWFSCRGA